MLWLEGIREIPGLILIFIAALTMLFPLSYRATAALFIMGLGYALYAAARFLFGATYYLRVRQPGDAHVVSSLQGFGLVAKSGGQNG